MESRLEIINAVMVQLRGGLSNLHIKATVTEEFYIKCILPRKKRLGVAKRMYKAGYKSVINSILTEMNSL